MMSKSSQAKRRHELTVFHEFAAAANFATIPYVAELREPPEPDIWYSSNTQKCYFELSRLADNHHAKYVKRAWESQVPVAPDLAKVGYPQRDVLEAKLAKSYGTVEVPVQLLLYFDSDSPHLEGPIPPFPFSEEAEHLLLPILRETMGPFLRIWYFERYRRTVLWKYP